MVGSAILRQLDQSGTETVITATSAQLDLRNQVAVRDFMQAMRPDAVILAAARVGGIIANHTRPAEFIYDNLMIATNVIHEAYNAGVKRLLNLGSSCIYPRDAPQPIPETALLTGKLEPTNEPYAIAKIAAIKLCESYNRQHGTDYRSIMPTNLYGPGDNFHPKYSHVLPALIRRCHEAMQSGANEVEVWGTGLPRREFLHVDDLASAALFVLQLKSDQYWSQVDNLHSHINVGSGADLCIGDLVKEIAKVTGFSGSILFDTDKPDGAMRKLLDTSTLDALGWKAQIDLRTGIAETYNWYLKELARGANIRAK